MHILLLTNIYFDPQNPRAAGEKFRNHLKIFSLMGHKVGLVAARQLSGERYMKPFFYGSCIKREQDFNCVVYKDFLWHLLDRFRIPKRIRAFLCLRTIKKYIKENGMPNIIHAHGSMYSGCVAAYVWKYFKIPYVLTEHMTHYSEGKINPSDVSILREAVLLSKKLLPISKKTGEDVEVFFGKEVVGSWINVPNMLDLDRFFVAGDASSLQRDSQFSFLSISRLAPVKSFDMLIESFSQEFQYEEHVVLRICGSGPLENDLKKIVLDKGLSHRIIFLGYIDNSEIQKLMNKSDVYVMSSTYESFGIPLVEALSCGVPVIATDCCGPESIVIDKVGLLIKKDDVQEMRKALRFMYINSKNYQPENLVEYARQNFGSRAVASKLLSIYENVLTNTNYKNEQ